MEILEHQVSTSNFLVNQVRSFELESHRHPPARRTQPVYILHTCQRNILDEMGLRYALDRAESTAYAIFFPRKEAFRAPKFSPRKNNHQATLDRQEASKSLRINYKKNTSSISRLTREGVQEGRLPAAGRPHDRQEFPRPGLAAQPTENALVPNAARYILTLRGEGGRDRPITRVRYTSVRSRSSSHRLKQAH